MLVHRGVHWISVPWPNNSRRQRAFVRFASFGGKRFQESVYKHAMATS